MVGKNGFSSNSIQDKLADEIETESGNKIQT
jgi:hypothetical protein